MLELYAFGGWTLFVWILGYAFGKGNTDDAEEDDGPGALGADEIDN